MHRFPKRLEGILAPIDFDEASLAALEAAAELARACGARLTLLHAVPGLAAAVPERHARPEPAMGGGSWAEEEARERLAGIARQRLGGIEHEILVRIGSPAAVIVDAIADRRPDLVVIATHGRTGAGRLLLGSVAEQVIRRSSRPVLVVPPDGRAGTGAV
ncbi:MAG: universal stress protein [Deltaproteobacteria bacterium]|nr:universal stress protein [Deltaproteobacteria bacterium]